MVIIFEGLGIYGWCYVYMRDVRCFLSLPGLPNLDNKCHEVKFFKLVTMPKSFFGSLVRDYAWDISILPCLIRVRLPWCQLVVHLTHVWGLTMEFGVPQEQVDAELLQLGPLDLLLISRAQKALHHLQTIFDEQGPAGSRPTALQQQVHYVHGHRKLDYL